MTRHRPGLHRLRLSVRTPKTPDKALRDAQDKPFFILYPAVR